MNTATSNARNKLSYLFLSYMLFGILVVSPSGLDMPHNPSQHSSRQQNVTVDVQHPALCDANIVAETCGEPQPKATMSPATSLTRHTSYTFSSIHLGCWFKQVFIFHPMYPRYLYADLFSKWNFNEFYDVYGWPSLLNHQSSNSCLSEPTLVGLSFSTVYDIPIYPNVLSKSTS